MFELETPQHTHTEYGVKARFLTFRKTIDKIFASKKKNWRASTCLTVPTSLFILIWLWFLPASKNSVIHSWAKSKGIIRHKYVHLWWSGAYSRALESQQDVSPTFTHRRMKCMCRSWGGQGVRTSPWKSQNIGFFSNTGPDPLKIVKLPSQLSILGHHRHASKTPFKRTNRRRPTNSGIWIIPPPSN